MAFGMTDPRAHTPFQSSYSGLLPGSCCRSRQGCHVCVRTPTPLRGLLHDRCRSQRSRPRFGRKCKQMATHLPALHWYGLHKAEKNFPTKAILVLEKHSSNGLKIAKVSDQLLSQDLICRQLLKKKKAPVLPWQNCFVPTHVGDVAPEPVVHCMKDYSKVRSKQVESKVAFACPNQQTLAKKVQTTNFLATKIWKIF